MCRGQDGNKEEAERFWHITDIRYSGLICRKTERTFFEAIGFIRESCVFAKENRQHISLRAVSIGVWFSVVALKDDRKLHVFVAAF